MRWTENFKRKALIRWLTLFFILLLLVSIIFIRSIPSDEVSFQFFEYPSEHNFHDILHSDDKDNFTKLIDYEPQLINYLNRTYNRSSNFQVVVIVKSSITHFTNREVIRQTWASERCRKSHNIDVYFALGETSENDGKVGDFDLKVTNESKTYNDILRFNFIDVYHNNTYKVMAIMDHFVNYHFNVPYLVIIDDDFFLDPSMLMYTINNDISKFQYHQYFGGYVWYHNHPIRSQNNKWYVSKEKYGYEFYPPYATGGFLLISNPMVKTCNKLLPYLKYTPFDDVLLGILLFKLNIYPVHMENVVLSRSFHWPNNLLASHENKDDLINFWQQNDYQKIC